MKIRVYYEDTDAGGIVYHTNYIKYCERARSELFFEKGLMPQSEEGYFVVVNINCNYIKSAKLGDMLEVKTSMYKIKRTSMVMLQEIYIGDVKIFDALITVAFIDGEKSAKIPQSQLDVLGFSKEN